MDTSTRAISLGTRPQGFAGSAESDPENFLPARRVWERYGVTDMTIHRWIRDERMNFPQPVYIGRFRYWKLAELQVWERSRLRQREAA